MPFPAKMPAIDYVRRVPWWALSDADGDSAVALAMHHVSLWSDSREPELTVAKWIDAAAAMRVLLAMEALRRCGIHRFTSTGDGRLLDDAATLTVEMNPACLARAVPGAEPDMREMMAAAMTTEWPDFDALDEAAS